MKKVQTTLKKQLDEIDSRVVKEAQNGFYESRLAIEMGMWEKGKLVAEYRGVNSAISWREMERKTGRQKESLKIWHDLYRNYPNKDDYEYIAKDKAAEWTDKVFQKALPKKALPPPESIQETSEQTKSETATQPQTTESETEETTETTPQEEQKESEYIHTETHEVSDAMNFAVMAISQLERIRDDDPKREEALTKVEQWIQKNRRKS